MPPGSSRRAMALGAGVIVIAVFAVASYARFRGPAPTAPPRLPPSPIVGVVVFVDQESLNEVNSFNLLTPDGTSVTLRWGPIDNAVQFSPSHLATHLATAVPIRAFYHLVNGQPVVYHLEDANAGSAGPSGSPGTTQASPRPS
jgi:hypothetical protein